MPQFFPLAVETVSLPFAEDLTVSLCPLLPEAIALGMDPADLGQELIFSLERHTLRQGNYLELLTVAHSLQGEVAPLTVRLEREPGLPTKLELKLEAIRYALPKGAYWGLVPALGIGAWAAHERALDARLEAAVRLDLARKRRLTHPCRLVPCQWFGQLALHRQSAEVEIRSLPELNRQQKKPKGWLERATQRLAPMSGPCVERDALLEQMGRLLRPPLGTSLLLIGPPGVGKSALVSELYRERGRYGLAGVDFWETTAARLVQKLTEVSGWQDALAGLVRELHEKGDILYVRNLAQLFEVGQYAGNPVSMGAFLREPLARGELRLVAECTPEELAAVERQAPGYGALLAPVRVEPPKPDAERAMVSARMGRRVSAAGIDEALALLHRYAPYSGFPGVAVELLHGLGQETEGQLEASDVVAGFCRQSGMPLSLVAADSPFDLPGMQAVFEGRVLGQDHAVARVIDLLAAIKTRLVRPLRPLASLLFVGPTGVGKTELAKALAAALFGDERQLVRFDMSEFSDPLAVMRLTGDDRQGPGLLTSAVRQQPFAVLLFDELEKAHPNFFDLLLQILGEGRLTDARAQVADFCSTAIIMTSNIGADTAARDTPGFHRSSTGAAEHYVHEVQRFFRPELFNRLDSIVPFRPLDPAILRRVAERELERLLRRPGLSRRPVALTWDNPALDALASTSSGRYGARALQRALQDRLIAPLARTLNRYPADQPLKVSIGALGPGELHVEATVDAAKPVAQQRVGRLSLAGQASLATDSRRACRSVVDGPFYLQLHNQWYQIERERMRAERRRKTNDFWKDQAQAAAYADQRAALDRGSTLDSQMMALEVQAQQMLLEIVPIGDLEAEIGRWQQAFGRWLLELFDLVEPTTGRCVVGVYGAGGSLERLSEWIQWRIATRGWRSTKRAVWRRASDGAYRYGDASGYLEPKSERVRRDGHLVGWEHAIIGRASALYFGGDAGRQRVYTGPNNFDDLAVAVAAGDFEGFQTPEGIHRKKSLENLPRALDHLIDGYRDHRQGINYSGTDWLDALDRARWLATWRTLWHRVSADDNLAAPPVGEP